MIRLPVRPPGARLAARAAALALCLAFAATARAAGPLVIAGGAVADANDAVYGAFVAALLGPGPVIVVPAAGDSPAQSGAYFTRMMAARGIAPERVHVFPVAVRDDASTPGVDESAWAGNAARAELLEGLGEAAGVWFSGGDQMRIVRTLRGPDGADTPLLALIRARHAAGAVVGGSSAGAAIMSEVMISGGDGFRGLLDPPTTDYAETEAEDEGRLYLARGLGFFAAGIVDQHFDREARLGRLVRALGERGVARGFGVDEDTALWVSGDRREARVLGRGGVTVLDAAGARFDLGGTALASGLLLHWFPAGLRFDLATLEPLEGAGEALAPPGSSQRRPLDGGGMALPNPRLEELLAYDLLDNAAAARLVRRTVGPDGRAAEFVFEETPRSRGWWRAGPEADRFTATGVSFSARAVPPRAE